MLSLILLASYSILVNTWTAPAEKLTETQIAGEGDASLYALVIYGATPGGVACAVRAAREGLVVQLISHTNHLGGMLTNGLSTMDTLYNGASAPIYDELRQRIYSYYREKYRAESPQFHATQPGHPKTRYEAHVVEHLINGLLSAEKRITVLKGYYPVAATRDASSLRSVTFRQIDGEEQRTLCARVFAECSYEGDLAAVSEVPYQVGREASSELGERHAGVIFMRRMSWPPERVDKAILQKARALNLFRYDAWYEMISETSTGKADPAVQGYNMRTVITNDPDNRVSINKPENYDPNSFREFGAGNPQHPGLSMPNQKFGMNQPKLVGEQTPYVEGDWQTRRSVVRQHREAALGLLYFRQYDPSVPEPIRRQWQTFGLPKDEFVDNGHIPYEVYVRETRRIKGVEIFTERDVQLAPDLDRAPIHSDSISVTEWFLDSHGCTPQRVAGSELEGMVMLKNQTFPGQVSYRTILPEGTKNLIVPVCLSSTHVGWGTIRLEPTWMSIAEAAAFAVALAKRQGITPAEVDSDELVRQLAERRVMVSFFNDVEGRADANWYPAVQYLGTQGYFGSYNARPQKLLTAKLADAWIDLLSRQIRGEEQKPTSAAQRILAAEQIAGTPVVAKEFAQRLEAVVATVANSPESMMQLLQRLAIPADEPLSRGDACRTIFAVMKSLDTENFEPY